MKTRTIERTYYLFTDQSLGNYYKIVFEIEGNLLRVGISCVGFVPPGCSEGWNDWGEEDLPAEVVSAIQNADNDDAFAVIVQFLDEMGWNVDVFRGNDE